MPVNLKSILTYRWQDRSHEARIISHTSVTIDRYPITNPVILSETKDLDWRAPVLDRMANTEKHETKPIQSRSRLPARR